MTVVGKVKVRLYVSSDRTDTDFTVFLVDVYPDGRWILVTDGIQRMRFRNSVEKEELITPGEIYEITVEMTNTAITFLEGHRIGLVVSSSNYPKYDNNLNDGEQLYGEGEGIIATNSVRHDAEHPSALLLPVLRNK